MQNEQKRTFVRTLVIWTSAFQPLRGFVFCYILNIVRFSKSPHIRHNDLREVHCEFISVIERGFDF